MPTSIAACEAGAFATVFGKRNGEAASGDSTAICLSNSVRGPTPAEPVPRRMPIRSSRPATAYPASASACLTATTAYWLPRSRRRALLFGSSGSVVNAPIRAAGARSAEGGAPSSSTGPTAERPAARAARVSASVRPRAVTVDSPVMTGARIEGIVHGPKALVSRLTEGPGQDMVTRSEASRESGRGDSHEACIRMPVDRRLFSRLDRLDFGGRRPGEEAGAEHRVDVSSVGRKARRLPEVDGP